MNEEQIKKMIADDFDNFINERLDSAIIFKYIDNLEKENLKLKEQYCERTDCSGRLGNSKKVEELEKENQKLKEKQKEFIEWLNNIVNNLEKEQTKRFNHSYQYKLNGFNDILSKYKEIIGDKDE